MAIVVYVVTCASLLYAVYAARTTHDLHTFCVVKVYVPIVALFHLWWWFHYLHVTCFAIVNTSDSAENVDAFEGDGDDKHNEDGGAQEDAHEDAHEDADEDEPQEDARYV